MIPSKKCTAINALLFLALAFISALAGAEGASAGAVMHVSGPLLATRADGSSRVLAPNSAVNPGETLVTQKNGYAQIKFSDGSLLILQPSTALTIDRFSYDAAKPETDEAVFTLQQGGVRSNAGLLGKRSKDRVTLNTPIATVGLQNASAIVQYQPAPGSDAQVAQITQQRAFLFASTAALDTSMMITRSDAPLPSASASLLMAQNIPLPKAPGPTLQPGLYVSVIDGLINVTNKGGAMSFAPGQFGFTPNPTQPPILLPKSPAIAFTPPPQFSQSAAPGAANAPKSSAPVDCVVR
ncbi:iron dicitrate transport regulator FecR [Oxalobacteraceae bacterium CAVE-383]|nr:iron dicitrate transport regulator FecR [Oxalobacteraceae bacterium CAVE-383]